jgi:ADP-ribose pyrophosphatase YjhB (NUDIX family)
LRSFNQGWGKDIEEGLLEAAKRGLLEETGYEAESAKLLSTVLHDSGRSDREIGVILARGCRKVGEGEERITTQLIKPGEFWVRMMEYYRIDPKKPHGGGHTLMAMALAFDELGYRLVKEE